MGHIRPASRHHAGAILPCVRSACRWSRHPNKGSGCALGRTSQRSTDGVWARGRPRRTCRAAGAACLPSASRDGKRCKTKLPKPSGRWAATRRGGLASSRCQARCRPERQRKGRSPRSLRRQGPARHGTARHCTVRASDGSSKARYAPPIWPAGRPPSRPKAQACDDRPGRPRRPRSLQTQATITARAAWQPQRVSSV